MDEILKYHSIHSRNHYRDSSCMSVVTRVKNGLFRQTKPRNPHSLENLKYLYGVLQRNQTISDANRDELVESLRSISEILIWGDQNDSSVFDFFLEKNMLTFFLSYMIQRYGRSICVQILQTLNILFENIRNETSLYYLLSNNHVNNIIVHKFDFNDEEITAYYISFLKTLSFKLNSQSINFFYNERNQDFPLYVEAIKFFDHSEAMVRIAVRTLTLNIYKVTDPGMQRFILDRTATEFFSNLVWFIRNHVLEFDKLIQNNRDINNRSRLSCGLEEYLDDIHYLEDIFLANVQQLNNVLKEQLMNRLLIPIYIFSLSQQMNKENEPILDQSSALFLLAEIFLVIDYQPVINELIDIILSADIETIETIQHRYQEQIMAYSRPPLSLDICLAKSNKTNSSIETVQINALDISNEKSSHSPIQVRSPSSSPRLLTSSHHQQQQANFEINLKLPPLYTSNWSEEEKIRRQSNRIRFDNEQLSQRPFFRSILKSLNCTDNDQQCFYALSLLLTMTTNSSVDSVILESACLTNKSSDKSFYNTILVDELCSILFASTAPDSNIRLITLNLTIILLKKLVYNDEEKNSYISDLHLARIEQAYEQSTQDLRRHFRIHDFFLDLFEDEYRQMQTNTIRLDYLLKDAAMLCTPTNQPTIGIEFLKRLPADDIERARRAIRVFFHIRALSFELRLQIDSDLPLTKIDTLVKENDKLDLSNSDLIACTVHMKETKDRRFLVAGPVQFILIEPDVKRAAWGIVKFCDLMQDVEVTNDKEDTRSLHITIQKQGSNAFGKTFPPILDAKFSFDDHIRCMTAKQNLTKGRQKIRQMKLIKIASILDIPLNTSNTLNQTNYLTSTTSTYSQHQFGYATPGLPNHPGRATLISGPKRQSSIQSNSTAHRLLSSNSTTASSPSFDNVEHVQQYSLSHAQSEQVSISDNSLSTPPLSRRTSISENSELIRKDSTNSNSIAPKSLREWHEKPVDLSEQPPLNEKINVQILSPNSERTNSRFFFDNDLATLVMPNGESTSNEIISTKIEHIPPPSSSDGNN